MLLSSCSNTGPIRDGSYWTFGENSLELIKLSSINKVGLVLLSSCSNTGPIRDGSYWSFGENSLELIKLSSINEISSV